MCEFGRVVPGMAVTTTKLVNRLATQKVDVGAILNLYRTAERRFFRCRTFLAVYCSVGFTELQEARVRVRIRSVDERTRDKCFVQGWAAMLSQTCGRAVYWWQTSCIDMSSKTDFGKEWGLVYFNTCR